MRVRVRPPVALFVAATVAIAIAAIARSWTGTPAPGFWFWFGACALGELLWVRMPAGNVTVSMASSFHFAAIVLLPAEQAMLACLLSGPLVEALVVRKPAIRAVFNGGQAALAAGGASWVLARVAGTRPPGDPLADFGLLAIAAAAAAYFAINSGFVSAAVALHERISFARAWRVNFGTGYELLSNGALFSLGALLAGMAALHGVFGAVLVILPLLVAFQGYRWHVRSRSAAEEEVPAPARAA